VIHKKTNLTRAATAEGVNQMMFSIANIRVAHTVMTKTAQTKASQSN